MAVANSRIIHAPSKGVVEMIRRHLPAEAKKKLDDFPFDCVALINAIVPNIYFFADIATKAGPVFASEMSGTCPQHTTTLAIFGDVSAVKSALAAIEIEKEK